MQRLAHIAAALRHRNFRLYVAGNAVSLVGLWTQRVAVGWLAWRLTHSGAWLGATSFADLCPTIFVGPFAGVFADRANRLRIVRVCQMLSMLQAAVLGVLVAGDWIGIEGLIALVALNGIVSGINQPARLALISSLVPRADLPTAVAINSITFNLARFIGPAVAGALIVSIGISAAFGVNAVSFLAFLVALARIDVDPDAMMLRGGDRRSLGAEIVEGVRYVVGHDGIGPLLLMAVVTAVGVRCYVELLPGFAGQVFGRGAGGLAAFASSIGIGAVTGGLWVALRGGRAGITRVVLVHTLFAIVSILAFASTDRFWLALPCAAVSGYFMGVAGISTQSIVQIMVAPSVRGRVLSLYGLTMRAGPAAGAVLLGAASEIAGLRAPLVAGAGVCMFVWLAVWRRRAAVEAALEHRPEEEGA